MSPAHYQLFTLAFPLFVIPQVEKTLCSHAYFNWGNLYCSILGGYISAEQDYMNLNGIVECCLFCQIIMTVLLDTCIYITTKILIFVHFI